MAHFAEIDENGIVLRVIVVANECAETEEAGQEFIVSIGLSGTWKQTSYNTFGNQHSNGGTPLRKNYAGIGYTYDQSKDAFIPPKPEEFPSFVLEEETCLWVNPVPRPQGTETTGWEWNEDSLSWESFTKTPS